MTENQPAEFSTGRGIENMPDGRPRPLSDRERARIQRTAGLRDVPFAEVEREHREAR